MKYRVILRSCLFKKRSKFVEWKREELSLEICRRIYYITAVINKSKKIVRKLWKQVFYWEIEVNLMDKLRAQYGQYFVTQNEKYGTH